MKLRVHIQPNARKNEVVGPFNDGIKIRIKAPPTDGAANAELIGFLSEVLKIPRNRIQIAHGLSGRRKLLEIQTDLDETALLEQLCQPL